MSYDHDRQHDHDQRTIYAASSTESRGTDTRTHNLVILSPAPAVMFSRYKKTFPATTPRTSYVYQYSFISTIRAVYTPPGNLTQQGIQGIPAEYRAAYGTILYTALYHGYRRTANHMNRGLQACYITEPPSHAAQGLQGSPPNRAPCGITLPRTPLS